MSDEIETLKELGLSANEAKLYLILVKDGRMKATQLALKSGLQRRAAYDTLQQLEKKGMVGVADMSGVKMFSPSPPSALLSFLDEKRDAVEKILPKLSQNFESEEKTGASVIYGKAGIKMVLEDIIHLRVDYCAYNGQAQFFETMPKTMALFSRKRKELGLRTKYLLLDVETSHKHAKKMPLAKIKYLDPSIVSAGVWWTYADRLVLFVLPEKGEPTTIFIKNAELATAFRKSFDNMFKSTPSR